MWVQGPVSPLSCYVTLDQSLKCSVPQFSHLKNRAQTALTSQGYSQNSKRKSNKVFIYQLAHNIVLWPIFYQDLSPGVWDLTLISLTLSYPAQSSTHGRSSNCSWLNESHSVQLRLIVSILQMRKETQRGTAALQGSHSKQRAELGCGIRTR